MLENSRSSWLNMTLCVALECYTVTCTGMPFCYCNARDQRETHHPLGLRMFPKSRKPELLRGSISIRRRERGGGDYFFSDGFGYMPDFDLSLSLGQSVGSCLSSKEM